MKTKVLFANLATNSTIYNLNWLSTCEQGVTQERRRCKRDNGILLNRSRPQLNYRVVYSWIFACPSFTADVF